MGWRDAELISDLYEPPPAICARLGHLQRGSGWGTNAETMVMNPYCSRCGVRLAAAKVTVYDEPVPMTGRLGLWKPRQEPAAASPASSTVTGTRHPA